MKTNEDEFTEIKCNDRVYHRLEIRHTVGVLHCIREGPYICHNSLVTHAEFLKAADNIREPRIFRILPIGGASSKVGDVFALITWYLMLVYSIAVIPIACYCDSKYINIGNAAALCALCMYHLTAVYVIFRNKKRIRSMIFTIETTAYKYQGVQNCFFDVDTNNTQELQFLNLQNRRRLRQQLAGKPDKKLVVMLCTTSYWRTRVVYPVICLVILFVFGFIGVIVQLETLKNH